MLSFGKMCLQMFDIVSVPMMHFFLGWLRHFTMENNCEGEFAVIHLFENAIVIFIALYANYLFFKVVLFWVPLEISQTVVLRDGKTQQVTALGRGFWEE